MPKKTITHRAPAKAARLKALSLAEDSSRRRREEVAANGGVSLEFVEYVDNLATVMADVMDHRDCPEYLSMRLAELHNSLTNEFNCEVADDVRLRFGLACVHAAAGHRPAG